MPLNNVLDGLGDHFTPNGVPRLPGEDRVAAQGGYEKDSVATLGLREEKQVALLRLSGDRRRDLGSTSVVRYFSRCDPDVRCYAIALAIVVVIAACVIQSSRLAEIESPASLREIDLAMEKCVARRALGPGPTRIVGATTPTMLVACHSKLNTR